jgi:hypothetical protein
MPFQEEEELEDHYLCQRARHSWNDRLLPAKEPLVSLAILVSLDVDVLKLSIGSTNR